jgi:hypothetical protein
VTVVYNGHPYKVTVTHIILKEATMKIHPDLKPSHKFPDFELPDQDGNVLKLSQRMRGWPIIIVFYRGIW